jgi:hypothetical protein
VRLQAINYIIKPFQKYTLKLHRIGMVGIQMAHQMIAFNKANYPEIMWRNINLEGYTFIISSVVHSYYYDKPDMIEEGMKASKDMLDSLEQMQFTILSRDPEEEYLAAKQTWTRSSLGNLSEAEKSHDRYERAIKYYQKALSVVMAWGDDVITRSINSLIEKARARAKQLGIPQVMPTSEAEIKTRRTKYMETVNHCGQESSQAINAGLSLICVLVGSEHGIELER